MKDTELNELLSPLVRRVFDGSDLRAFSIASGRNYDDEPVINIEVNLGDPNRPPDLTARADLTREILAVLGEHQDERFPLIIVRFPSDEPDENFYPDRRARRAGLR
jgi:hypothetical protein